VRSYGRWSRVEGHRRRHDAVVDGKVGLTKSECVEDGVAETERWCRRGQPLLVAKDVLDILGADVASSHDLVHRRSGDALAKELDEKSQPDQLALERTSAGGEYLEVADAGFAEADERRGQRIGSRTWLVGEESLLVRGMLDVLASAPATWVERDLLGTEEDGDRLVVSAHNDGLAHQAPGYRVLIAIEGDAEALGDALALDIVAIEGDVGERREQLPLLVLEDEGRDLAGLFVDSIVGEVVAPLAGLRSNRSRKRRPRQKRSRTKPIGRSTRPFSLPLPGLQATTAKPPRACAYSRKR
jgi:hypothetical protein